MEHLKNKIDSLDWIITPSKIDDRRGLDIVLVSTNHLISLMESLNRLRGKDIF